MIDGSNKRNRQLGFEVHSSHFIERHIEISSKLFMQCFIFTFETGVQGRLEFFLSGCS